MTKIGETPEEKEKKDSIEGRDGIVDEKAVEKAAAQAMEDVQRGDVTLEKARGEAKTAEEPKEEVDPEVAKGLDEILSEAEEGTIEPEIPDKNIRTAIRVFTKDPRKRRELLAQPSKEAQKALVLDHARKLQRVEQMKLEKKQSILKEKEKLSEAKSAAGGKKKAKKGFLRKAKIAGTIAATTAFSFVPQTGEQAVQGKEVAQKTPETEIVVSAEEEKIVDEKTAVYTEAMKKIPQEMSEEAVSAEAMETKSQTEEVTEVKVEKKEVIKLDIASFTEKLKNIFAPIVEKEATFKDLHLVFESNILNFSVELSAKGIPITITGVVVNKDKGLSLENTNIQAKLFKKKITKRIIPLLEVVISAVEDSLGKEYGDIEQMNIDESGNVKITLEKG